MKIQIFSLFFVLSTGMPSLAQDMTMVTAGCVWKGNNGETVNQSCRISGANQSISRTEVNILWEDGYRTAVRRTESGAFETPSGIPVQISRSSHSGSFGFPQEITIAGQGVIQLAYKPLPDYIRIDERLKLQAQTKIETRNLPIDKTYTSQYFRDSSLIGNRELRSNTTYKFRDLELTSLGGFPVRFLVQNYPVPVSLQAAISNAYLVSPAVNFSRAMVLQNSRALYAASPLGDTDLVLESCLLEKNDANQVNRTVCVFSSP